jgi:hypothetical protein
MLIQILTLLFFLLILYQIFLAIFGNLREGVENPEYKEYDKNSPCSANILAEQNAGNIAYLKQRLDELMNLKETVMDVCGNIVVINEQLNGLANAQSDKGTAALNGQKEPVSISGI